MRFQQKNYLNLKTDMVKKNNATAIEEFWNWFALIANSLEKDFNQEGLLKDLDDRISQLGDITWEIGPGKTAPNILIVSPSGDKSLLSLTKDIVKHAPQIKNWEFYYAKPPKEWISVFSIYDNDDFEYVINIESWEYNLYKFADGSYDIVIKADNIKNLTLDLQQIAMEVALDNILGEEKRIGSFEIIERVDYFENKTKGILVSKLKEQLS